MSSTRVTYTDPSLVNEVITEPTPPLYGRSDTGYGPKIPTRYRLRYLGRLRRVYMMQYANSGSAYIIVGGKDLFLDTDTEYALRGEEATR